MYKNITLNGYSVKHFPSKESFLNFADNKKKILVAINAEKIMKNDNRLKNIVNNNIGYPDGIGAVWALRQKGINNAIKIPGCEFWLDIIERYYKNKKFYLIGSTDEVIKKVVDKLQSKFSGIDIVGYRNGYINETDKRQLKNDLMSSKADIVFVAQGSPKQEYFMEELSQEYPALYMGLGGSFDIYSGLKKRAPNFFLKNNLEWFYRLMREPTRIKRNIVFIKFLYLLLSKKL